MNDLIPSNDFDALSLVPIILASLVFILGGLVATRLKSAFATGRLFKKAAAPVPGAESPQGTSGAAAENPDPLDDSPAPPEEPPEASAAPPPDAPPERQEPSTGGLLEKISALKTRRKGKTAAPGGSLFGGPPAADQPVAPPAAPPTKSKNVVHAEFIIAQKEQDIKLAVRDGKITVLDPSLSGQEPVKKVIYLNPDGGDIIKHPKPITRYQAKADHNNLARNIRVQGNISISVAEAVINRFPEKTELYPLALMALYWVDKQFKKPRNKKMVILTFVDMVTPITYVLRENEETLQIIEEFLPGRAPNVVRKEINDDEIYRLDIISDGVSPKDHFDFSNNYQAPEASHVAEIYLNQFIANARVRPLTPPSDVDLKRYIAGALGCGLIYGGVFLGNNWVKNEEARLVATIGELKQMQQDYDNKVLDLWAKRLPEYLKTNKVDFVPLITTLEAVGKIELFNLKDVLWERESNAKKFIITGDFSMSIGDNFAARIREKFTLLPECETVYEYDGGTNETSVVSTCNL